MAKVSIIVPIYNSSKYLNKCIDSLLNQTLKDIEIILLNDGSTDKSEDIIKEYQDKRIKYIKKDNTGIGKTRNMGLDIATGEYIMFIDSDDYIALDCAYKMYNKAEKDKCDIVISDYFEDHDGKIEVIKYPSFNDSSLKDNPSILNKVNLGPCNKIYKSSLLKKIRFEENLKYEDAPFVVRALVNANKIGKIDEALSYYVIHSNSETTIRDKRIFDILDISKIIIDIVKPYHYLDKELTNLVVLILADYTIQQRYIKNGKLRNKFIDEAFDILNDLDNKWTKCDYLKTFKWYERIIKTNKQLTKIYCMIYQKIKNINN